VLDDHEVQRRAEPVTDAASCNLVSEEEGDETPSPPHDQSKVDQGTSLYGTQSKDGGGGHKMEIDPSPIGIGCRTTYRTLSPQRTPVQTGTK
jgi:hypothetical protein